MKQFNLDEYLVNPNKKVVTRDGRNVTIHCTNFDGFTPIIAEIEGERYSTAFCKNGKIIDDKDTSCDLFFVPEKHEGWINVFEDANGNPTIVDSRIFASKEEAEKEGKDKKCYVVTTKVGWGE